MTVKYLILTYASQRDYDAMAGKPGDDPVWSAADFAAMGAFMESFNKELAESGELVETRGLTAPVHTRRLQLQGGVPVVTDGPYAETKELLGGLLILEARDLNHAIQLISKHPGVKMGTWEIRPVQDITPMIKESEKRRAEAKR